MSSATTPTMAIESPDDDDKHPSIDPRAKERDTPSPNDLETGKEQPGREVDNNEKEGESQIVRWEDGEVANPENFSTIRKWTIVLIVSMGSLCATTCSSMVASTYAQVEGEFAISAEAATLGLSLFVGGLGLGPLFLGPLSEFFGRAPIYRYSYLFFVIFNIPVAVGKNAATWLVGRFLSGVSGAAFLSVAGGTVSDLFRGRALRLSVSLPANGSPNSAPMAVYSMSPFLGPIIGPIIAGFINQGTCWRWTWYVQIIWATIELLLLVFAAPETYGPVLLKRKAIRLRQESGNQRLRAPLELDQRSISSTVLLSCTVPFKLVATEPMALALNIWTSILLGILYMFFSAFPIVFGAHGFNLQEKGLAFIGIGLGVIIATACNPLFLRRYTRVAEKLGRQPPPEEHLVKGLYGAFICPLALFWFAFTTYPSVHWIVPIIASVPFGFGIILAYSSTFTFLVDAYRPYAASAMASNSFMRSALAAGFPLFTTQMYANLGTVWASALCGFLLLALAPFPFLFFKYGHRLRNASRYSVKEG